MHPRRCCFALLMAMCLLLPTTLAGGQDLQAFERPAAATEILPLNQVRIGMKGYGLTVFHGTKIEPFNVEVISVQRDFAPQKGVIWIRCPDERMQKTGPVQGMSGSPIYLWDDPDPNTHVIGKGRLIGAFAFGFALTRDCYVGVQPIEEMRDVGQRAGDKAPNPAAGATAPALWSLRELSRVAQRQETPSTVATRCMMLARMLLGESAPGHRESPLPPPPANFNGGVQRLLLPVTVRSQAMVEGLGPMLQPLGLALQQAPAGTIAGLPPREIDPAAIRFAPGSVLSIPLAYGDMDMSASGTVTDVLPDGKVLAFGHAMFGQGPVALPMATGYVHYIVPHLISSFKFGGTAVIRGSVVRDEQSAVAGLGVTTFRDAPVRVTIAREGMPEKVYSYHVVQHREYTPILAAIVSIESLMAQMMLPPDNTIRVRGDMMFDGQRSLSFDTLIPSAGPMDLAFTVLPPVAVMTQNAFESVPLKSIDLRVDVEDRVRRAQVVGVTLDRAELEPGQKAAVTVRLLPHGGEMTTLRMELDLPADLPDGTYDLTICDAQTYLSLLFSTHPHLTQARKVDDVLEMVKRAMEVPTDSLFMTMTLPPDGLAVGRTELPRLPSSRRAMIAPPTNRQATVFARTLQTSRRLGVVPMGSASFPLTVRRNAEADPQKP